MQAEKKYVFNHFYRLRHDIKRSHILAPSYIEKGHEILVHPRWMSRIHPIYAMIFSLLSNPITLTSLTKDLSYFFDISDDEAENLIKPFINNKEIIKTKYGGAINSFPPNIIIEEDQEFAKRTLYRPEQFSYKELDMQRERFYIAPASLVFMVNNTCATDCVYCYANKSVKTSLLPFNKVENIIKQAHELGIVNISIVGGEVFLYKHWKKLYDLLVEYDLRETLVSTKIPLKKEDIIALKSYKMPVQISLDAIDGNILSKILDVNFDYAEKIKHTISLLDKYDIAFQVSTVLTTYNESIGNLNDLHDFLSEFRGLKRWEIRVGFKSLYSRCDFDKFKLSKKTIANIDQWVQDKKKMTKINISWSLDNMDKYFKSEKGSRTFKGSRCSANYSNMVILPDGKVTICEQLYWDHRFIIGDLTAQSIKEVWNSPRALALSFPKKKDFSDESICKTCELFDDCFSFPNKCFADVLKGYGKEKWDYPDPRCSKAPDFLYDLLHV